MVKSFYRKFIDWRRKAKAYNDLRKSGVVITSDSFLGEDTTIGFGTKINGTCFLGSNVGSPIRIGRYCAIAHNLRIRSRNHNIKSVNMQNQFARAHGFKQNIDIRGSVEIGSGVWIGDNVLILSGVKIGDGAVIGAGSVVTRNIFPYGVACGVPAREYKKRFAPEVVKLLINTCWWNWSEEKIRRNKTFFEADLTKLNVDQIVDIMID